MNAEVEECIKGSLLWAKLPKNVRQLLGNSQKDYEKMVVDYSVKNQLRYKGNLIRLVRKDEEKYYEGLMNHSRTSLMLYPYHLCDIITRELRITPFHYYVQMMQDLMTQERSYDSLPNFTAADCTLLIQKSNPYRYANSRSPPPRHRAKPVHRADEPVSLQQGESGEGWAVVREPWTQKLTFRRRPLRELLPASPGKVSPESWWVLQIGHVMEEDVKACDRLEKDVLDILIDEGSQIAGSLDITIIQSLYTKGLVYFDVPVEDDDQIIVPPLDGFVMNRVLGDYFETLLYKIFVSLDEHTTVKDLAEVLQIDLQLVKDALSLFCRLGFAKKKWTGMERTELDLSWPQARPFEGDVDLMTASAVTSPDTEGFRFDPGSVEKEPSIAADDLDAMSISIVPEERKRVGFIFDSTLTAFLMMGNLSPSLKTHAVTLFEVGKLGDEALDSFVDELSKVQAFGEGEAERYFEHAEVLRATIAWARSSPVELDLLRCESLLGLDARTRLRVLKKTYRLLLSMAPLTNEVAPVNCSDPPHLGPPVAEVNSAWFRLFVYQLVGAGPVSVLIAKGWRLERLPAALRGYPRLLLSTWTHDPGLVSADSCLPALNDALQHSAVFLQAYSRFGEDSEIAHIPFPGTREQRLSAVLDEGQGPPSEGPLERHPVVEELVRRLDLSHTCGYITLLRTARGGPSSTSPSSSPEKSGFGRDSRSALASQDPRKTPGSVLREANGQRFSDWTLFDCVFGVPLFDRRLNSAVLASIADAELFAPSSRAALQRVNRETTLRVLDFVNGFQPVFGCDSDGAEHNVPYPTHNLLFDGTQVCRLQL